MFIILEIEFIRRDYNDKTVRLVKVVKATEFLDPDLAEFKITKDNIMLSNYIEKYIKTTWNSSPLHSIPRHSHYRRTRLTR